MNVEVQIEKAAGKTAIKPEMIRNAVKQVLAGYPEINQPALTVLLTGDEAVQQLNHTYMGIDSPTDVLSFPSGELPGDEDQETYLGDIMISVEAAARQAAQGGHSVVQEIELLAVHGALHLLGFDHGDEVEKNRMWGAQAVILSKLSNPLSPP